jgi:hypothetical protein
MDRLSGVSTANVGGVRAGRFVLRIVGIALRLAAVAYAGQSGAKFFYQGF